MNRSRRFHSAAALLALVGLLFMQFALASYVCPASNAGGLAAMSVDALVPELSGCSGMDMDQPNLCQAHDHAGHQSLDKPALPHVQPFYATDMVRTLIPVEAGDPATLTRPERFLLARTTAPPLSILHCCFRI